MNIINIIKSLATRNKQLNIKELPSMGLFYPDDMKIYIGKCTEEDIITYENIVDPNNILTMVYAMRLIVDKCVTMNKNYDTSYLKSIDVTYIMFEIVKHTTGKEVSIEYYDDARGKFIDLPINASTFNYIDLADIMDNYLPETKEFEFDGYRLSLPTKGIETSLTEYFSNITNEVADTMVDYSYDFIYFLGNRNTISYNEIDNLLDIFNDSMSATDKEIVSEAVKRFSPMIRYSLKHNNRVIELHGKINMSTIWE